MEQLQDAIQECLQLSTDCSKGPHGPIGSWDVSAVTDTERLFDHDVVPGANKFTGDISKWNMSSATIMTSMFAEATSFNVDLSKWDVSKVNDMPFTFYGASLFNGDLSKWDVSRVTNMLGMFYGASSFNGDISKWDVSSVTNMQSMFEAASSFNVDLSSWDVSKVANMSNMFKGASYFARTLCGDTWITSTAKKEAMFEGSSGRVCGKTKPQP